MTPARTPPPANSISWAARSPSARPRGRWISLPVLALLTCAPLLTGTVGKAWGDLVFAPHVDYDTGASAAIASGDFNRDGHPDLAVANPTSSGSVSIYLNSGDGTFQGRRMYDAGARPVALAVADLNGDGSLDLAVANSVSNTVSILLGNGDGSFQANVDFATGLIPTSVGIADLNGDGRPDLAVTNSTDNTVSVLLGNGAGGVGAKADFATGSHPHSVAIGDVNGDGRLDIMTVSVGAGENSVSVLLGNGDGTFQGKVDYPTWVNPRSIAIADLNRDGALDLAVANAGDNTGTTEGVSILLGNGDGTFRARVDYPIGPQPGFIAAGDLTGDGIPDLAVAITGGIHVNAFLGNGDGTFPNIGYYVTGEAPVSLTIADLNGDGRLDLAVLNATDQTMSVLLNLSDYPARIVRLKTTAIQVQGANGTHCFQIEPIAGDFTLASVDLSSLIMKYGTAQAPAITGKTMTNSDSDHNGIQELQGCWRAYTLAPLFAALPLGNTTVTVTVEGNLLTGGKFSGGVTFRVKKDEDGQHVAIAPNPLNPASRLSFTTLKPGSVKAEVFDAQGRRVRTILNESLLPAGYHEATIDGRGPSGERLASGVYFYRVEMPEGTTTGRFAIMK